MKILIINSSPLPGGHVSTMLRAMAEEAASLGYEVTELNASRLSVKPCIACMKCRTSGRCILPPDDAQRTLELIRACDALVVGAPCYWGGMPGTLKLLFDRLVYGLIDANRPGRMPIPLLKGRKLVIVTTSTTPWPLNRLMHQTSGVVRGLKEILCASGMKLVAAIQVGGTRSLTAPKEKTLRRCRKAIYRF